MTRHYCTYFDRHYAAQGYVLVRSLLRHDPAACLWVLCLDDETVELLRKMQCGGVRILTLGDLEAADPGLRSARADRSWVEFLFTLSPCLPRFVLAADPSVGMVTYLDADLWFVADPSPIFAELGAGNVLVVGHNFPPWLRHLEKQGRFNVGILCFRNNAEGRRCLDWWRERCLEWCRDVVEPGRYADQKYLDAWPERFQGVVVCRHPGVNVAPWNWMTREWVISDGGLMINGLPLIVFHFAALRRLAPDLVDPSQVEYGVMPHRLRNATYGPYLREIDAAEVEVARVLPGFRAIHVRTRGRRRRCTEALFQLLFGTRWQKRRGKWRAASLGLGRWSGRLLKAARRGIGG